jgi:hypothetical protein
MKPFHIPHALIFFSILLVAVTFLAGALHAFDSARAASATTAVIASHQTENQKKLTPTTHPISVSVSGDTTGIIALAIIIVAIILVGAILGTNRSNQKRTS